MQEYSGYDKITLKPIFVGGDVNKNLEEAGAFLLNNDFKSAIELYYKALADDENNIFILNKIAHCYMSLNN